MSYCYSFSGGFFMLAVVVWFDWKQKALSAILLVIGAALHVAGALMERKLRSQRREVREV